MEDTHEFVEKLKERQEKDERNKKRQATNNDGKKLPTKQHGTNK